MQVVDGVASRLDQTRARGAEAIDFNVEDPVAVVHELTGGIGAAMNENLTVKMGNCNHRRQIPTCPNGHKTFQTRRNDPGNES